MRIVLLTALTMVAFAANSILNRLALADAAAGPAAFAALRLVSGALVLTALVLARQGRLELRAPGRITGGWTLAVYMLGFSFAYVSLDAGLGALILFGTVQATMFAGALAGRETVPPLRWLGAAVAFGGLVWLLWPAGAARPDPAGAALMAAAGVGWGLYSLHGRKARDPLPATGAAFVLAAPAALVVYALLPDGLTARGALLACVSGGVTSALGYALWYRLLPQIGAQVGAVAQLTAPVLAVAGGIVFLGEALSQRVVIGTLLVLGGVSVSVLASQRRIGSSGS